MNRNEMLGKKYGRRLVASAFVFLACYVVMLAIVLLMIIINDVHGWTGFIEQHYTGLLSLIFSLFFLFAIVYFYYYFEDPEVLVHFKSVVLIFTLLIFCTILCYVFGEFVHPYSRPYALFAILFLFLFDRRQAVILNFVFIFSVFSIDLFTNNYDAMTINTEVYATLLLGFICGTIAVFVAGQMKTRLSLLLTGFVIAVPSVAIVLLFQIPSGNYGFVQYVESCGFRILGCLVSAILSLALMPVFERIFNRLTVFRLRELTSTSSHLLNRLKTEAPGTFNHSLIVAQLCETCAVAIGENAELARAAAYYHDVGKLKQPDCFTENQSGYNVHDELTPELSADIIRSHAKDGYDLLVSEHLPQIIADVAREHHGTMPIKYFYDKANRLSGGDVNVKDYSYLGPTPRTKIAAIVMIADASEAAVRSLADRSPQSVEKVVRSIIEERMDLDQFADCDITQKELTTIKQTIVDALSGVHHHRVEYPAIRFTREREAVPEETEDEDE